MSEIEKSLGSDNHAGVHPQILEALNATNTGHSHSYGGDALTKSVQDLFRQQFGPDTYCYFVFNGTAANVLSLKTFLKSYQSVFCTDVSHLNLDECGAPESLAGIKLQTLPSQNGKLTIESLKRHYGRLGDQHAVQPGMVSLTQPTELGTVYSLEELEELRQWTQENGLFLHIDGARLIHAAHFLKTDLKTAAGGADVISFGGTKNGLLFGEAVLVFDPERARDLKFYRKQYLQLPSKMRFLSAQFKALFEDNLWQEIAAHGFEKAKKLATSLHELPQVEVSYPVQSNAVFMTFPKSWTKPLKKSLFFYIWDEHKWEARLMISFDTNDSDLEQFLTTAKHLSQEAQHG